MLVTLVHRYEAQSLDIAEASFGIQDQTRTQLPFNSAAIPAAILWMEYA